MSFFSKLFGGRKNGSKVPDTAEAIQRLRELEEMLTKKQVFLEHKIGQEIETAKKLATKNRILALQALKKKKIFEKQLREIDGTLTKIEYQSYALENAKTNAEVLKMMGFAAKAMKNAHDGGVDQVHNLMDEIQDQQDLANEISEAISTPIGSDKYFDEDELMKELEELEQEELDEKLLAVGVSAIKLPSPPVTEPSRPGSAGPCSPAAAEPCSPASAGPCPTSAKPCNPTSVQPNHLTSAEPSCPISVQPNRPTSVQPNRPTSVQPSLPTSAEPTHLALAELSEEEDKELKELAAWGL